MRVCVCLCLGRTSLSGVKSINMSLLVVVALDHRVRFDKICETNRAENAKLVSNGFDAFVHLLNFLSLFLFLRAFYVLCTCNWGFKHNVHIGIMRGFAIITRKAMRTVQITVNGGVCVRSVVFVS